VSAGTKREKHFDKFILKDLFKAGEDQMCPAALDRLDQQVDVTLLYHLSSGHCCSTAA
jgi:hypothetical protein